MTDVASDIAAPPRPSRGIWVRRLTLLGAAGMAAAALAQPALARPALVTGDMDNPITLTVGAAPTTTMFPAITGDDPYDTADGDNLVTPSREDPAGCIAHPGCALVPIKLAVPADSFKTHQYVVNLTVTWDTQVALNNLPEVTNAYGDQLEILVYDTPPVKDDSMNDTYTTSQFLEPAMLTDTSPPSGTVNLVVVNDQGVNTGFQVQASLIDNSPAATYYPPGTSQFSTYGKGTNNTAVTVPKAQPKENQPAPSTKTGKSVKPVKNTGVVEPPAEGVTTAPATTTTATTTISGTTPTSTVPVDVPAPTVISAGTGPALDASATRVAVGSRPDGALDPALVQLASDKQTASILGLKDENITGNKVATVVRNGTSHGWLVLLSLLLPAVAIVSWMFYLARKRRSQVDTRNLGTAHTA